MFCAEMKLKSEIPGENKRCSSSNSATIWAKQAASRHSAYDHALSSPRLRRAPSEKNTP